MLLTFTILFLKNNCQAGKYNEFDEEYHNSSILINVFSYLFGDCLECSTQYNYVTLPSYEETDKNEELGNIEGKTINSLPNELLFYIATYLSPLDIIRLVKSNKQFICLVSDEFWLNFNKEKEYVAWNEELPAIKVAFSYYWFRNNKVRKAAAMGFPRAHEFIKQQEKLKRENPTISYEISNYVGRTPYDELIHRKFIYRTYW